MPPLILIVDDEPKITRLARDYLEKNGFRVLTAADGQSALTTGAPRKTRSRSSST
jgi:DNA-binding response OmpR family regulator